MTTSPITTVPADPSWWLEDALRDEGSVPPAPPLAGDCPVDVAIVGGGFAGLWTALALAERRPDLSVALIEAAICGAGASGKNGGKVHGYWTALGSAVRALGDDGALAIARAGGWAQDGIRAFARRCGRDVWWRDGPNVLVATAPAQDEKIAAAVAEARRLGVEDTVRALSPAEVQAVCASPVFRGGLLYPEAATVHPARLARALRQAAIEAGVALYEGTPMLGVDAGRPNRVRTPGGHLYAREVVLATNAALAERPEIGPHLSLFSSYAVMSEPAEDRLAAVGWTSDASLADLRMFLHYFRRTPDGRVLMGSGSGPIAYGAGYRAARMTGDRASAARAARGLHRLVPGFEEVPLAKAWGGAIDVAADRLPFFKTLDGTRIHYACGFSGHGVNATYIAGQCLASLVLGETDRWSTLPLCTRTVPRLPPEPLRFIGGNIVRWGILACEEAEERQERGPAIARAVASLPRRLGLKIGVR